jgi:putative transcription factor
MERMDCEICGKPIEKRITVLIDGTQFDVCNECSSLGKKIDLPEENFIEKRNERIQRKNFASRIQETTLVEGFGKKIMQARQKKGLTLRDLAMKVYEKESVIQRIESEKFIPEDKIIKKLEKELEIKLTE